ncbi:MAG TPA: VWA domain-containing protein, partial [Acidobacteria bacterium]|nr:VWA domain-containing protein [Acidobacteriota bacterium]
MSGRVVRRAVVAVLLAVLTAGTLRAQYRGGVEVDAVVVPVTVRTRHGRVVKDVPRKRFHLRVDGMPIPIQDLVPEEGLKLSLAFIVDTSGSMAGRKIQACRDLIDAFVAQRKPGDEYSLWTFGNGRVLERFPFGMSWYLLPRILESLKPWGLTALYDMIRRVPEVAAGASYPRRAVILTTDGVDNASKLTPHDATLLAQRVKTPI